MTFKPNIIPLTGLVLAIGTMAHAEAHSSGRIRRSDG
jgi:hypothetical protein